MKKKLGTILMMFTFISISVIGQNLREFKSQLSECGMKINIPSGFTESKIIENDDMGYEYAVKYQDKNFELRYAIRPITYKKYTNDTVRNELESQRAFRNSSYATILHTIILNITGGVDYKIQEFDRNAVKNEFNADWGATTFVNLNSGFGKGFKYCMIVAIHKKDIADAYYFYMADTKEKFAENSDALFHSLKFE